MQGRYTSCPGKMKLKDRRNHVLYEIDALIDALYVEIVLREKVNRSIILFELLCPFNGLTTVHYSIILVYFSPETAGGNLKIRWQNI